MLSLLAQQADPINTVLTQYGAPGLLAAVGMIAARVMWRRMERMVDDERKHAEAERERLEHILDKERERADRFEGKLLELNEIVRREYATSLDRSTAAMQQVTQQVAALLKGRGGDR